MFEKSKKISEQISNYTKEQSSIKKQLDDILSLLPNIALKVVPVGKDENSNKEISKNGEIPKFNFKPKSHYELGEKLKMLDFDLATKTTANLTEGANLYYTDARARAGVSVTDSGGDGSLSYNSSTGVVTYTGPSATEVRAHFSAGAGITVSSGAISIAADAIKDTMIDWGTGATQVSTADIPENTNLYYTNVRADARIAAASVADLRDRKSVV